MNIEIIIFFVIAIVLWLGYGVFAIGVYKECDHQLKSIKKIIRGTEDE